MSRVRGPNSALTEFLRSQGINANEIRRRHERRQAAATEDTEALEEDGLDADPQELPDEADQSDVEASPRRNRARRRTANDAEAAGPVEMAGDEEVARIAQAAARKRRGDDLDAAQRANEGTTLCAHCGARFTLTVYSKAAPDGGDDAFLCRACSAASARSAKELRAKLAQSGANARGTNHGAARKRRKQVASELLNLRFLVPPSLQDLCINLIAEHIDSVEELGGLTASSFNGISRILSKNRRLSPRTLQLFLRPEVTVLELWDCSELVPEAYNLIPTLCPNLERLVLGMCGQLEDEALRRLAALPNLTHVRLDGAFMVRKDAWLDFLDMRGADLRSLRISSVYRVDAEVVALLAASCQQLEELSLHRLVQMRDPAAIALLGGLPALRSLALSELEPEAWSDEAFETVLNMVGAQLEELRLRGSSSGGGSAATEQTLTDRTVAAVAATCVRLHSLELVALPLVTDNAVADMFEHWSTENLNTGLQTLSLERCILVGNGGVGAALRHSGATLVELNLNSLKQVSPATLDRLSTLPNLTKLDIGFVGRVDPEQIYRLSTSPTLKQVLAFGNIRLSGMPLPTGMTVVGTM